MGNWTIGSWTMRTCGGLLLLLVIAFSATCANAAKKVALVIGTDAYMDLPVLQKAVNDARAISLTLESIGFTVIKGENLTRRQMNQSLSKLERIIDPGDQIFFFFAGHGVAMGATNYLIPADMPLPEPGDEGLVRGEAFAVDRIIARIQSRGASASFVVLDACRNNPFKSSGVRAIGSTRGLADMSASKGVFVLYSAGIGQTALDRLNDKDPNPNSVFTRNLVPLLKTPGLSHVQLAKQVQSKVDKLARTVDHEQQPAYYDQVIGNMFLVESKTESPIPIVNNQAERFYKEVKNSNSIAMLKAFTSRFPDSFYATLVNVKIKELEKSEKSDTEPENTVQQTTGLQTETRVREQRFSPTDATRKCDLLAGSPNDKNARTAGVDFSILEKHFSDAITNCEIAVAQIQSDLVSQFQLGRAFDAGKKYETAAVWYRKTAEQGYASAQNNLGILYEDGSGITKDYKLAIKWYNKAADLGSFTAQNNLGVMHENGTGVTKNNNLAVQWYRKAAEQGFAIAQNNLGIMYKNGTGVAKDINLAVQWYQKSAEQNYASAQNNLGIMYERGLGVTKNYKTAVHWYRQAAVAGEGYAQSNLGYMYENGYGVAKDHTLAVKWYRKSADKGYAIAQNNLGVMYKNGNGVAMNYGLALQWYRKSAEQNHASAQNNLGVMYENGTGVTKSNKLAAQWYGKAAEQGESYAQSNLGHLYTFGSGVAKDGKLAAYWILEAISKNNRHSIKRVKSYSQNWPLSSRIEFQRALKERGFYAGALDGKIGPGTLKAMEQLAAGGG